MAAEHAAGIPYNRMVLAGFSQGGCMSLFTGLQLKEEQKLAGLMIMSSYLPAVNQFHLTPGLEGTRVFHTHGTADARITPAQADETKKILTNLSLQRYDIKSYPEVGHTINPAMIADVLQFL
eukprot:gene31246-38608_t